MQNWDFMTRITSLYCSHTSSMVFCIQNSVFSTRIGSVYGSQPTSVDFFAFTTASLWPELIVSMGPRPHLSLCACKTTRLTSELLVCMGPSLHLWFFHAKLGLYDQNYKSLLLPHLIYGFFAFKTASLAPELQVSMGPSPHLLFFLHSQQRHYDQN